MKRTILTPALFLAIGALLALSAAPISARASSRCPDGAVLLFQSTSGGATLCAVSPTSPAPPVGSPPAPKPPSNQHPPISAAPPKQAPPPAALPDNWPGGVKSTAKGLIPPPPGGLVTSTGEHVSSPSTTIPAAPANVTAGTGAGAAPATQSFCSGSTPIPYLTTNPFYSTEQFSLVVEPDPSYACSATVFYFYYSTNGGQTYTYAGSNSIDQLGFYVTNWAVNSTIDWAAVACDSACSNYGYLGSSCGSQDATNYTFNGQHPWFYQDWGTVNNGYGYTGADGYTGQSSGFDQYIGWLETPQPGTNLTNLGEQFTYVDAFTSNDTFYQVGYAINATGLYLFAATTSQAGGWDPNAPNGQGGKGEWTGIGCINGASRFDWGPGLGTRGVTVRCTIAPAAINVPINQEIEYDVHTYTNMVYVDVNGVSAMLNSPEVSNGNVYRAQAIEENSGDANVNPTTAFSSSSPTRITGWLNYSYFALNGQDSHAANDYKISSDLFDGTTGATSEPGLCGLVGSLQKDAASYNGYNLHWDKQYQDC